MRTTPTIDDWKQRLVAMVDDPPYVFKDTPDHLIERHRSHLANFEGFSEEEVASVESTLGFVFPRFFRSFVLEMGKAPGELFCGSDFAGLSRLGQFRAEASELIVATDSSLALPRNAVVFLFHQGYVFNFFVGGSQSDAPVMQWCEGDSEPVEVCPSFQQFIETRLQGMESGYRRLVERGGYYLTLYQDGGRQQFPALNSGDRPLDKHKGGSSIGRPPRSGRRLLSRVASLWRRLTISAPDAEAGSRPSRR